MPVKTMHYSNGELTIAWKPELCTHSGICAKGLAGVFSPKRRPWIDMAQSDTQTMMEQVKRCPSGALSFTLSPSN
jgi:uncharacterized Fe-S cluster protein YjdI